MIDELIGHRVVEASMEDGTLTLDNGVRLEFQKNVADCCSWVKLTALATTDNVITDARFRDDEQTEPGPPYFNSYRAWLHVITESGEINEVRIAEAEGHVGNGYYLHGFGLDVRVIHPDGTEVEYPHYDRD